MFTRFLFPQLAVAGAFFAEDELSPTFHVALNVENLFRDYVSDVTFVVESD